VRDKEFDCVKTMRTIRERLSKLYSDVSIETEELKKIREKYGIGE